MYDVYSLTCIPGSIKYKGCKIQLLDLPGIIEGAKDGKGRGRQVIAVGRTCNLILIVLDAGKPMTHKRIIEKELEGFGIRLNQEPPNIIFKRKEKGGISITKAVPLTKLDVKTITAILKEYKVANADITFRQDCSVDQLIDVIEGNRKYIPALYVLNKIDTITIQELDLLSQVCFACITGAFLFHAHVCILLSRIASLYVSHIPVCMHVSVLCYAQAGASLHLYLRRQGVGL